MPTPNSAVASERTVNAPALLLLVLAVMIVLYLGDRFLAHIEQREISQAARREFETGRALQAQGKLADAEVHLHRAHTLVRSDENYALALAEAQVTIRQGKAARQLLDEVLSADSNNAEANLLMARLMVSESEFNVADSYYHRAIYGTWLANSAKRRLNTRLELAQMLAVHGTQQELLSETLALLEATPESVALTKQIAPLLLRAGAASRAAATYRFLLRRDRDDPDLYRGLGQAELQLGNYQSAHSAFSAAFALRMQDQLFHRQMVMAGRLASIDPTPRRLGSREKYSRSIEVLELVRQELADCLHGKQGPESLRSRFDEADRLISTRVRGLVTNEQAETRLNAAESLWALRPSACAAAPQDDDLLPVIMGKLSR